MTDAELAAQVMQRTDALAQISDEPGCLTRTYGSPAMRRANDRVAGWMHEAGLTTEEDAIGNLIGHYAAREPDGKTFLLGSHLDTVRDAGKFDGALGVLVALACVQRLHEANARLPFALDVIGFADEEGARFHTSYLGSRVMAGTFDPADLKRTDASGVSLREAILQFGGDPAALYGAQLDPRQLLGYAEVHLEQGPVLEAKSVPVGVVTAISGQSRIEVTFTGCAAHAGTTPMTLRRDALAGAAQFITGAEEIGLARRDLVVTVGEIAVQPGASNVIPGQARLSLDVRHRLDFARETACDLLRDLARKIAKRRGLLPDWHAVQNTATVSCAHRLTLPLRKAVRRHVRPVVRLPSGAGHDAAAMAAITKVAMLFVRCKDGLSHHPDESVQEDDVCAAIAVMNDFLQRLAE